MKKKKQYIKGALVLSVVALILWSFMGTGASLAWFMDSSPEINNIFNFATFELEVSQRMTDGSWKAIDKDTKVFDENALYEPGYVQVVYLKVKNRGTVPFDFKTAVNVNGYVPAENVFGQSFNLQDHLKFGLVVCDSEDDMKNSVPDREAAVQLANMPLGHYATEKATLKANGEAYIALIVRMPEEVGNVANYYKGNAPEVELGITVSAEQIKS